MIGNLQLHVALVVGFILSSFTLSV
jgi:hypothetical protein